MVKKQKFIQMLNSSFNVQNGENMSDNEAEQEEIPPGALTGAEEQPAIAQPQVVLPNILPVANFQVTPLENLHSSRKTGQSGFKGLRDFTRLLGLINKPAKIK